MRYANFTWNVWNHFPFQDKSGKDDLVNIITEGVIDLDADKKFGFISIHWNKNTSVCTTNLGSHAETYIRQIEQLNQNGKKALEGDICHNSYDDLLNETLTDTIREIMGYRYQVAELIKNPVIKKIEIVQANGSLYEVTQSEYAEFRDAQFLYVDFQQSLAPILKNAKKIRLTIVEDL